MACGLQTNSITKLILWIFLIDLTYSADPHLEILPTQSVQRKPIGKPLILTCQPNVEQKDLITDLRWRDSNNNTILPKPSGTQPVIYTEALSREQLMLVISSLTDTMAGYYYCSASYANSEMLENKVKVETYVAITWKDAPEYQSPVAGSNYVVRCVVTANPPPTVDWLRNGDQIKLSDRFVVKHDGLLITNVQESDDGIYTCRAAVIQTGELMERNIRLDVQIKPEITSLGEEYEAIEGQEFSVICSGRGKPAPEFKWINQDQKDMSLADRFSVVGHNGQMSATRIEENDRGVYTCVARNSAGITERKMRLNVVVKPKIYEMKNITIPVSGEAVFTCKAKGRPAPLITFRRWKRTEEFRVGQQENDDRIILEQEIDEEFGESSGTLLISKVLRPDDGLYQCVARNKGDTAFEVGHIAVEYPPNFDHMKELPPTYSWEERPANLSCMAMAFPNATIEWRWNERLVREMQDKFLQIVEEGPRSDLIVTPVDRRYYSAYKCIAVNRLGREEHMMELREAQLPTPIAQAKARTVTATTIIFDIIGPPTELGMPIKAYTVQYKEERNLDWSSAINRTWTPDTPYVVEGLRPQTLYTLRFAARNDVGLGQWSPTVIQGTPSRSVPVAPRILNQFTQEEQADGELPIIASTYSDKFELIWNRPADNGDPIDFFTIRYCPGGKVNNIWNEIENMCLEKDYIPHDRSNQLLDKLSPDTYYRVEIKAHNGIGYSPNTSVYLKTARGESQRSFDGTFTYQAGFKTSSASNTFLHIMCINGVVFSFMLWH
ncbi:CLUMA_CG017550, isoform A [Clunio marinus]|uniref:CLUMA_CG017550, isoform A n=1 Tax=Clunio marinus TaxID=568069 RepID=A0A1J1IY28_9DIPT|nr:CLUMA_CG017550, isoform A [Clunio marinus]